MAGYVSPLEIFFNKASPPVRRHVFPKPDGTTQYCYPPHCRECWREKNWPADA